MGQGKIFQTLFETGSILAIGSILVEYNIDTTA